MIGGGGGKGDDLVPFLVANICYRFDVAQDPLAAVFFHLRLLVGYFGADNEFSGFLARGAFAAFGAFFDLDDGFFGFFEIFHQRHGSTADTMGLQLVRRGHGDWGRAGGVGRTVGVEFLAFGVSGLGVLGVAGFDLAGLAEGLEDTDVFDDVVGLFVEDLLLFFGDAEAFAV